MLFVYVLVALLLLITITLTQMMMLKIIGVACILYVLLLVSRYYSWKVVGFVVLFLFVICSYWSFWRIQLKIGKTYQLRNELLLIIEQRQTEGATQLIGETQGFFRQRYQLTRTSEQSEVLLGAYIHVDGKAQPLESPKNKYLFHYEHYIYSQGVFHQVFNPRIHVRENKSIKQQIYAGKSWLQLYITTKYNMTTQPLLQAFVLGDSSALREQQQFLVELGVLHLFVLSKRHIRWLQRLFNRGGRNLRIPQLLRHAIGLLSIWALSTFLWKNIALKQLLIYTVIDTYNYWFRWYKQEGVAKLAITAVVLIIMNPYMMYNQGFIFIFSIHFGLAVIAPYIRKMQRWQLVVAFPWIVFLLLLPSTLYQQQGFSFFQVALYAILAPAGMCFFLASFVILLFPQLELYFNYFQQVLPWLQATFGTNASFARVAVAWLFCWQSYCLCALYFWLCQPCEKPRRWRRVGIVILFIVCTHYFNVRLNSIHFLSLPYGEMTIIKENGIVYVIDVGGSHKEKDNVYQTKTYILQFLQKLQITKIDHLILTHDDLDHVGAYAFFVSQFPIHHVYYNQSTLAFAHFSHADDNTEYHQVRSATTIGSLQIFPVYAAQSAVNSNNKSLITYGVFGGKSWLFMGDLEREGEYKLLRMYPALQVDVLKIGHHGSKTSSSSLFLETMQPQLAIITVQKRNRHQHPHREVMQRLEANNIRYYNTNEQGSIHFFFWKRQGVFVIE